jgi:hypothetical protein
MEVVPGNLLDRYELWNTTYIILLLSLWCDFYLLCWPMTSRWWLTWGHHQVVWPIPLMQTCPNANFPRYRASADLVPEPPLSMGHASLQGTCSASVIILTITFSSNGTLSNSQPTHHLQSSLRVQEYTVWGQMRKTCANLGNSIFNIFLTFKLVIVCTNFVHVRFPFCLGTKIMFVYITLFHLDKC